MLIESRFLPLSKVTGIIHIGAHNAEELPIYLSHKIEDVLWVEANCNLHAFLAELISAYPRMHLGLFAAGDKEASTYLNIANNSQASSILSFGTHSTEYPSIQFISSVQVNMKRVDDWIDESGFDRSLYNFANLDIQGFELPAIKGMIRQLDHLKYIYTEVNTNDLYVNCTKLTDLDSFLSLYGFKRVLTFLTDQGWGDALYAKEMLWHLRASFFISAACRRAMRFIKLSIKLVLFK